MKPKLIKSVSFAIAGLLALGGAATATLFEKKTSEVGADPVEITINLSQIGSNTNLSTGTGSYNGFSWSGLNSNTTSSELHFDDGTTFSLRYTGTNASKVTHMKVYGFLWNSNMVHYFFKRGTETIKDNQFPRNGYYTFQTDCTKGASSVGIDFRDTDQSEPTFPSYFDTFEFTLSYDPAVKVSVKSVTGLNKGYVSTNGSLTSKTSGDLKPSGTEFPTSSTLYFYADLAVGYKKGNSGWTLKSGTADTPDALYYLGSRTIGNADYEFDPDSYPIAKTKTIYRKGNGTSDLGNITLTYNQVANLGTPTRDGYTFFGWAYESDAHDPDFTSNLTIEQVNTLVLSDTVNLYAVWGYNSNVTAAIEAINAISKPIEYAEDCHNTIVNARTKYDSCSAAEKALVNNENYQDLVDAEAAYAALRDAAIAEAIGSINAIGEVVYTNECYDLITEARYAYVSLVTDEDKDLVTNYDVLEQAELTYDSLRDAAVANVINLIDAIGVVEYTQESFDKIDAATDAYSALVTAYDRDLVTNYSTLLDAQNAFMDLAAPRIHEVEEKINAIGTVEYTAESKALIDAARSAFDALVGPEPTKGVSNYITLLEAEEAYKAFDDQAKADVVKGLIDAIGEVKKELVSNYQTLLDAEATYAQLELDATRHEIVDEQSGVKVATSDGTGIPKNINLKVVVKTNVKAQEGSTELENIKKLLASDEKISNVFDVKLIKTEGGVESEIQPSDIKEGMKLIVTIALPKGINISDLKILHIHSESSIEFVENFKVNGNEVSFEVSSLSELAFIQKANTGLPVWAIALIVVGGVLLLLCLLYILFMFVFNKWCIKDNKVVRAIKLHEKQSRVKVILFPLCFTSRLDTAVFSSKAEAEKFLGK